MIITGVALAACAALTHTAIDSTRKYAASVVGIPPDGLVAIPALLDMFISCAGVALSGRWRGTVMHPALFATATISSSLLLLVSRFMYQRAIQLSPLSLTIPYLAFTPAILIATAYVFLGELPSPGGLLGVCVVAMGGYLLNMKAGGGGSGGAGAAVSGGGKVSAVTPALSSIVSSSTAAEGLGTAQVAVAAQPLGPAGSSLSAAAAAGLLLQRSASCTTIGDVETGGGGKRGIKGLLPYHRRIPSASELLLLRQQQLTAWQQEPGTLLMIGVAIIWSVTASLDKLGVLTGPTIWVYFAAQRLVIGLASLVYILAVAPRLLNLLRENFLLMLFISTLELASVILFLLAVRHLLVSYVVAIKRCNVLFSVVLGALVFRESIGSRLPYVFLMMLGMTVIVLEPGSRSFVHSHT
ncbi:hypothetical protein Vretimale_4599 [Volvox reticuliferus]|uniref:EamA domain-containing protein n=1 Tax=Volvox reticuliferus TaxID=1737510 RepID=A0A8J4G514_9CHLO|nr:hypothetical protein Vretifemale_3194 [Volvox reticuliferus]GIL99436.1 hypothetical protein Vretimale_4599 [Volvox reticuliferus]